MDAEGASAMRSPLLTSALLVVVFTFLPGPTVPRGRAPSAGDEANPRPWPKAGKIEAQPLLAQVRRLQQALDHLGSPLSPEVVAALGKLKPDGDAARVTTAVEALLDPLCLAAVEVTK